MSLEQHLDELRTTIIRILIILALAFGICYFIGDDLSEIMLASLRELVARGGKGGGKIIYLSVFDKVITHFQLAFWGAIILSSPFWFYQLWLFISPGLYQHEKKVIAPFIVLGFLLFIFGVGFGYFVALPLAFETLMDFGVSNVQANIELKGHIALVAKTLVLLGFLFQLPNILLILGFMGLVTKYSLRKMRRYVYFIFAILSALLTPADVVTMLGLWVPMVLLYEVGCGAVVFIVHPYLERRNREE